jgi:FkbM family methyltransferase
MQSFRKFLHRIINKFSNVFRKKSFALDNLDQLLAVYLNYKNGFFVEVGANNGIRQSNTLFLEKFMGWKGLLIEAIPTLAEECRQNRPRCIVENVALVSSDYSEETVELLYCNLMSVVNGDVNKERLQFLHETETTYVVKVPARTLSAVLAQHGIERVDLLSLDVEGYEAEVLKGLDFMRCRPRFMIIEVRDRVAIESIINSWYQPIAILSINSDYQDILYKCRDN